MDFKDGNLEQFFNADGDETDKLTRPAISSRSIHVLDRRQLLCAMAFSLSFIIFFLNRGQSANKVVANEVDTKTSDRHKDTVSDYCLQRTEQKRWQVPKIWRGRSVLMIKKNTPKCRRVSESSTTTASAASVLASRQATTAACTPTLTPPPSPVPANVRAAGTRLRHGSSARRTNAASRQPGSSTTSSGAPARTRANRSTSTPTPVTHMNNAWPWLPVIDAYIPKLCTSVDNRNRFITCRTQLLAKGSRIYQHLKPIDEVESALARALAHKSSMDHALCLELAKNWKHYRRYPTEPPPNKCGVEDDMSMLWGQLNKLQDQLNTYEQGV
ncbi:hypothetical protein B0H66DRAFT_625864 [Apodospora peruviana]|uniref:Uncharacterized protein n=1 Tax=Apodospora peruviana TaxID=516989 RepID=A0AAE0I186_9PEZI|nr:hypothetical protein B0H66DRAFT_625864 [Apodospora peruviana]